MGIPSYFSHIIKTHRNIVKNVNSVARVHNLYLDSNSIVYDSAYAINDKYTNQTEFELLLINEIKRRILEHIERIQPNRVYIAFDGVAPVAKLQQQRERRFKSQFLSDFHTQLGMKKTTHWNTVAITPGTLFMEKLHTHFSKISGEIKAQCPFVSDVLFSSWKEAGEGEHKLFQYIRSHTSHLDETTLVYGLDADLIMLSICHLEYCPNLFLYRETPDFIRSIDSSLKPNESYVLDISQLGTQLYISLTEHQERKFNKNDVMKDYIFMCFFLGNDFMPHFPALNIRTNGIFHLIETYQSCMTSTMIQNNTIVWRNVRRFIEHLSKYEESWVHDEYKLLCKREKYTIKATSEDEIKDKITNIPCFNRTIEHYIDPPSKGWQTRYYDKCFNVEYNTTRIKQITHNFLEALEWTFIYYTQGCKSWTWKYNYNYAPLLHDMCEYIPYFDTEFIEASPEHMKPLHPHVQLAYVLPPESREFLPSYMQKVMNTVDKETNQDYTIEWTFCKYFWEAHTHMPHVNLKYLTSQFNNHIIRAHG